jgi:hypothetical protein
MGPADLFFRPDCVGDLASRLGIALEAFSPGKERSNICNRLLQVPVGELPKAVEELEEEARRKKHKQ